MAKTNAERQAEYKANRKQLNFHISPLAYQALTDTSAETGKTKLEILEGLLLGNTATESNTAELDRLNAMSVNCFQCVHWDSDKESCIQSLTLTGWACSSLESWREKLEESKQEPEQTWAFSHEDLQEQARLIERLTTENSRLSAELQLTRKTKPYHQAFADNKRLAELEKENGNLKAELELARKAKPVPTEAPAEFDINALDKIQLLELLKQLENREKPKTFRHGWNHSGCECLTAKGDPCKNIAEEKLQADLVIDVCKVHYQKYKHLD